MCIGTRCSHHFNGAVQYLERDYENWQIHREPVYEVYDEKRGPEPSELDVIHIVHKVYGDKLQRQYGRPMFEIVDSFRFNTAYRHCNRCHGG